MALVGRYNSLQVVKHTNFGLYLDGAQDGEILLPNRYIPKDIPSEDEDLIDFSIEHKFDYVGISYVKSAQKLLI